MHTQGEISIEPSTQLLPWLSVAISWLCFGSFAVPMKWKSVVDAEVHPMIYQCYKTFWTAASAHLILLVEPYQLSSWGLLSGFAWVPAGVAAVIAVQHIGITCGQAIWQVSIIISSLCWGFLVLHEGSAATQSATQTLLGLMCMVVGMLGMTFAFSLQIADAECDSTLTEELLGSSDEGREPHETTTAATRTSASDSLPQRVLYTFHAGIQRLSFRQLRFHNRIRSRRSLSDVRFGTDDLAEDVIEHNGREEGNGASVVVGVSAALFNGIWGGSNLVPSHFAPFHGIHFVLSFGVGALVANAIIFAVFVLLCKVWWKSPVPSLQLRVMALPGFLSGVLWSAGNASALYAVSTLGQGIGNSLVQCSVIISGIWGICYYKELAGLPVLWWAVFCGIALFGIDEIALARRS